MKRDYDQDVTVDKDKLEIEWEIHPTICKYWSLQEVEAREEKDKAVRRLTVMRAKVAADVRTNPIKYGIDKITVDAVATAVELSKEVELAEQDVIQATKAWGIVKGAVENMHSQRKAALHDLTELWKGGYYSVGGVPREMKGEIENRKRAEINETVGVSLRRRANKNNS